MGKVYLYLLKRNKKDAKIVGVLNSESHVHPTILNDLTTLGFSAQDRLNLREITDNHRLEWEMWIESAENYSELRNNLHQRGFVVPPSSNVPILALESKELLKSGLTKLNKNKVMTRRMN